MESTSWDDKGDKKDTPNTSANDPFGRPSNFIYGPGRSAVFGSAAESAAPAAETKSLFSAPEKSEPEKARVVIPAEVTLPTPVAETPVAAPAYSQFANSYPAPETVYAVSKEDDDDEEDTATDTPAPFIPPVQKSEPAKPLHMESEGEILFREPVAPPEPEVARFEETTAIPEQTIPPLPEQPRQTALPQFEEIRPPTFSREPSSPTPPFPPVGGNKPPTPPPSPERPVFFDEAPEPEPPFQPPVEYQPNTPPAPSYENMTANIYIPRNEFEDAHHDTRRKIAGVWATTLLAAWWVNHQAKKRDKALSEQIKTGQQEMHHMRSANEDHAVRSSAENQQLYRRLNEQRPQESRPNVLPPIQQRQEAALQSRPMTEQLFGDQTQSEQLRELQPEERLKHSAWHSYVERDGQIVKDAIQYGDAFRQEQAKERIPTPFGAHDARFGGTGGPTNYYDPVHLQGSGLPSGQVPQDHRLATGQPTHLDPQHLLPPSEPHPLVATLMSPWLWLGVGVLMIAFFLAATI